MKSFRHILCLIVLVCLSSTALADRKDRGIVSLKEDRTPFIEKGHWTLGGTVSGSTYSATSYQFAVLKGIGGNGYSFSIKPGFNYALRNDLCIGVNLLYDRNLVNLESAGLSMDKISINVTDYYVLSHNYGAELSCTKFLPIGNTGRYAIYVSGGLQLSGGQSKITNRDKDNIIGTFETSGKIGIYANPGLAMYLTPHCMMNVGLGIVGIDYTWVNQTHNQVDSGKRSGFGASYMLNILAISLGVHYCF